MRPRSPEWPPAGHAGVSVIDAYLPARGRGRPKPGKLLFDMTINRKYLATLKGAVATSILASLLISPVRANAQAVTRAGDEPRIEYRAEILVLRHLNNEARSFEAPPQPPGEVGQPDEAETDAEQNRRVRWRGLPWAKFKLKSDYSRLRRSRDFRPLLHLGWTQAALDSSQAGWIPIRGQAEDGTRIDGRARLMVNRYLNLRLELDAAIPDKGDFQLAQSRRMKSGELHYFDHPEFGVLVMIIPEPPPPPPPPPPKAVPKSESTTEPADSPDNRDN